MARSSKEKSAETRSAIIESAYSLFLEHGFNATGMREISRKAGVTVGAIYNHFWNKEEIWKEIVLSKHPYKEIIPLIQAAEGDTIAEFIRSAARLLVHELNNRPDFFNLMFIEIVEFKAVHMQGLAEAIVPQLAGLAETLDCKRGRLRNISPLILIRSFGGLFFSYYITGILMNGIKGIALDDSTLNKFVDLYLFGILERENHTGTGAG
ncbi:MAG: TetR/AcrR family transcriptional regulator [Anaerolineaceae bacterium]